MVEEEEEYQDDEVKHSPVVWLQIHLCLMQMLIDLNLPQEARMDKAEAAIISELNRNVKVRGLANAVIEQAAESIILNLESE